MTVKPESLTSTFAGKDTSLVLASTVRSPVIVQCPAACHSPRRSWSEIGRSGAGASKKSGLLRWVVSGGNCVQSESVWISTDADFKALLAGSTSAVPVNRSNPPHAGRGERHGRPHEPDARVLGRQSDLT